MVGRPSAKFARNCGKIAAIAALFALAGCGGSGFGGSLGGSASGGGEPRAATTTTNNPFITGDGTIPPEFDPTLNDDGTERESFFDLFANNPDPNTQLEVNTYLWNASLDVLSFLPIESIDPFSGVIVMGYGTPPGGRTSYRATVQVRDPALEGRALRLALATRSGPADPDTVRAVEDAIFTRARQLREIDLNL